MSALSQKTLLFQLLLSTPTVEAVKGYLHGVSHSPIFAVLLVCIFKLMDYKVIRVSYRLSKRRLKHTSRLFNNKTLKKT